MLAAFFSWFFRVLARYFLFFDLIILVTYRLGWIHRLAQWIAEWNASELVNGAKVTFGSIRWDLWTGHFIVTDFIIHTPQRDEWAWESPVVMRIGTADVHVSLWSVCRSTYMAMINSQQTRLIDVYSAVISDVQIFIERRRHVLNLYLLDPAMELPNPKKLLLTEHHQAVAVGTTAKQQQQQQQQQQQDAATTPSQGQQNSSIDSINTSTGVAGVGVKTAAAIGALNATPNTPVIPEEEENDQETTSSIRDLDGPTPTATGIHDGAAMTTMVSSPLSPRPPHTPSNKSNIYSNNSNSNTRIAASSASPLFSNVSTVETTTNDKANEIVSRMLRAVSKGRSMSELLQRHKDKFVENLRDFEFQKETLQEGVRVVMQMGELVKRNVHDMGKIPPKKKMEERGGVGGGGTSGNGAGGGGGSRLLTAAELEEFRFGRIVLKDGRIFTATMRGLNTISGGSSSSSNNNNNNNNNTNTNINNHASAAAASNNYRTASRTIWNKPIYLKEVALTSAELSPPMSSRESGGDRLPAIGQPMDKIIQICVKRGVAEMAKSNTSRLLNAALGEVFNDITPSQKLL